MRNDEKRDRGFSGFDTEDMNIRLQLEKELQATNERLKLALQGANDGEWDWNMITGEVYFSELWGKMLGYGQEELGKDLAFWAKKVHPADLKLVEQDIREHIDGKTEQYASEHRLKAKSGEYVWVLDRGKVIYNEQGDPVRMVGTHQDIDYRKRLELRLNEINEDLEKKVAKRTEELTEANRLLKEEIRQNKNAEKTICSQLNDLQATYEKLKNAQLAMIRQEKLASIGQLAASVAHELNNPLGFISSNFYVMKKYFGDFKSFVAEIDRIKENGEMCEGADVVGDLEERYRVNTLLEDIRDIFEESEEGFRRVSAIVDNLLAFARSETGKKKLNDLNKSIQSTLSIAANEFKHTAELEVALGNVGEFEYDGGELNQVVLNLVLNAAQAIKSQNRTDMGRISIASFQSGEHACFTVTDDGPGMSKDTQEKIFEPFFTTKEEGKGTGLGLNIAYDIIVNRHCGNISVDSEPGKTVFTVCLPMKERGCDV